MRILVVGNKSYVGRHFKKWLSQWSDRYIVDSITLRNDKWKDKSFHQYDVLFHVAGIAHQKEGSIGEEAYYKVNRDLAVEVANKAKHSGIKQFIFMSSMSVYGVDGKIAKDIIIDRDTPCSPNTFYGKSKLEAEIELKKLQAENFRMVIVRAPMIYGPGCPGNYARLKKLVMKVPIFPVINNQRSMIFIDNFCEFIRLVIDNEEQGMFFPQNREYVNTFELVQLIAKENLKNIYFSKFLSFGVQIFGSFMKVFNKVFGNLVFDLELSAYRDFQYCVTSLEKSIEISESKLQ